MNAYFQPSRFIGLLRQELMEKYRTLLIFILSSLGGYLGLYLFCLLFELDLGVQTRSVLYAVFFSFACLLIPYLIYRSANRREDGLFYALTPASTLEKTLSMLLICSLIFPLSFVLLTLSFDSILSWLPFRHGFQGHLWGIVLGDYSQLPILQSSLEVFRSLDIDTASTGLWHNAVYGTSVVCLLNMLFRRHKIGYSILCYIGWVLLFSLITGVCSYLFFRSGLYMNLEIIDGIFYSNGRPAEAWFFRNFSGIVETFLFFNTYILPLIFWALTYLRIRRVQY